VRPAGRREVPGRPLTYATTAEFLSHFGLSSRRELPGIDELRATGMLDPVDLAMERMGTDMVEQRQDDESAGSEGLASDAEGA